MRSQRIEVSRLLFGPFTLVPLLLICFSFGELQADDGKGKAAKGQLFEPARTGVRSPNRHRRSRRHMPTVSNVILPSLTPAVEKKTVAPVVTTAAEPTPRYGYGSNLDNPPPVTTIIQPQPIYIFSPRYNNTQYWPVNRYYGYGYGYRYGSYSSGSHHSYSHHSYSHGGAHISGGTH